MPSYEQQKICPQCGHKTTSQKCAKCGTKANPVGNWTVRYRWDKTDKQLRLSSHPVNDLPFKTKKEAQEGYKELERIKKEEEAARLTSNKNAYNMTFEELLKKYEAYYDNEIKDSSILVFMQRINGFVLPYFKDKIVGDIIVNDIADWKININKKTYKRGGKTSHYSYAYKSAIFSAFVHFLNFCIKYYGLRENVASKEGDFSKKGTIKKVMEYWLPEEFDKFYLSIEVLDVNNKRIENVESKDLQLDEDNFDKLRFKLFFNLAYIVGCRKGENSALQWKDFNLSNKTVYFGKTASRKNKEGVYKITPPKTDNSYRTNYLPDAFVELLVKYQLLCKQKYKENFAEDNFVWDNSRIIAEQSISNCFEYFVKKAGVKKIRIHDLRHSCVSFLICVGGYDLSMLYVIADIIGDTPEMVLKTYGHMFPNRKKEVLNAVNEKMRVLGA